MVSICRRCGRVLTSEPWAGIGVGRVCANHWGITPEATVSDKETTQTSSPSRGIGVFDVILERDANGYASANIPHEVKRHSPDGFEWGYGGSGPEELALNILSSMIGLEAAQENGLYQQFKWDFIAHMPEEGGTIREDEIKRWLIEKGQ